MTQTFFYIEFCIFYVCSKVVRSLTILACIQSVCRGLGQESHFGLCRTPLAQVVLLNCF